MLNWAIVKTFAAPQDRGETDFTREQYDRERVERLAEADAQKGRAKRPPDVGDVGEGQGTVTGTGNPGVTAQRPSDLGDVTPGDLGV